MTEEKENIYKYQSSDKIDWRRLNLVSMGETEYGIRLIKLFVENGHIYMSRIARAIAENNSEDLADFSHKLKGISAHLGLKEMAAVSYQLEMSGAENNLKDCNLLLARLEEIMGNLEKLLARSKDRKK